MTGNDDGAAATGGMRGITEDTPNNAGAPGEAGGIDGVSAAGAEPATYDVGGYAANTHGTGGSAGATAEAGGTTGGTDQRVRGAEAETDDGLISGDTGGVTGTSDR